MGDNRRMGTPLVLLLALASATAPDCAAVRRDLAHELDVLRAPAQPFAVATNLQQAMPSLEPDTHYVVTLAPESRVAFIVPPGHEARDATPNGGILYLDVRDGPGRYRIAIDTGHWIDVVDSGPNVLDATAARLVPSVDHVDAGDCTPLRKVVDFELAAGKTYRIHLSGRADARVALVVTRVGSP